MYVMYVCNKSNKRQTCFCDRRPNSFRLYTDKTGQSFRLRTGSYNPFWPGYIAILLRLPWKWFLISFWEVIYRLLPGILIIVIAMIYYCLHSWTVGFSSFQDTVFCTVMKKNWRKIVMSGINNRSYTKIYFKNDLGMVFGRPKQEYYNLVTWMSTKIKKTLPWT